VLQVMRLRGTEAHDTNSHKRFLRSVRWSIKRVIRATFELVMETAGTYTKDLYWCCSEVERYLPEVLESLHASASLGVRANLEQRMDDLERFSSGVACVPCAFSSGVALVM
jgi:hypothetical protein